MLNIVVIGGSGHIGSYLIPRLVKAGHRVVNISRSRREPYINAPEWKEVQSVVADRVLEDQAGTFTRRVKDLCPDVVIDNICFTPDSAHSLAQTLMGHVQHLLVTGTIWVHGYSESIPTREDAVRKPIGDYGINKNLIEKMLMEEFVPQGLPVTILHPGHIVGCGWPCLNPQGNFNLQVFQKILNGENLLIPNLGLESVHHVHADDVAQLFQKAIATRDAALGESFHVVAPQAMTLRGYAEAMYRWAGHEPCLTLMPLAEMAQHLAEEDFEQTTEHVLRSPCMSIEKAKKLLGYQPRYSGVEACQESVRSMLEQGHLKSKESLSQALLSKRRK